MPQIEQDPTNVACPDFTGAAYATIRQIMTNNAQVDNNHAIEQLTAAWNLTHKQEVEAWRQQVQVESAEQEEFARLAKEEKDRCRADEERLKDKEKKEQEKKRPKIQYFPFLHWFRPDSVDSGRNQQESKWNRHKFSSYFVLLFQLFQKCFGRG